MKANLKYVFIPLGISIISLGIVFGLKIDRFFFSFIIAGIALLVVSAFLKENG